MKFAFVTRLNYKPGMNDDELMTQYARYVDDVGLLISLLHLRVAASAEQGRLIRDPVQGAFTIQYMPGKAWFLFFLKLPASKLAQFWKNKKPDLPIGHILYCGR
jgi:hypothetical protein